MTSPGRLALVLVFLGSSLAGGCERDFGFLQDTTPKDAAGLDASDARESSMPDTSIDRPGDVELEAEAARDAPSVEASDVSSSDATDAPSIDASDASAPDVPDAGPRRVLAHQVAMNGSHLCVIDPTTGDILCRGDGEDVPDARKDDAATSEWHVVTVSLDETPLEHARTIAVGRAFGCAIASNDVWCWGTDPGTLEHFALAHALLEGGPSNDFETLQAGERHVCVSSPAYCWGDNTYSQINNVIQFGMTSIQRPLLLTDLGNKQLLTLGVRHTCANDGDTTRCWGLDDYRQCGNKSDYDCLPNAPCRAEPIAVDGITGAIGLGLGTSHSCAIKTDGAVACWGLSDKGQAGKLPPLDCVGDDCIADAVDVANVSGATRLALGKAHSCALTENKLVYCWGSDDVGQLGLGSQGGRGADAFPVVMLGGAMLHDIVDLAAGDSLTCAITLEKLYCWGLWATDTILSVATEIPLIH